MNEISPGPLLININRIKPTEKEITFQILYSQPKRNVYTKASTQKFPRVPHLLPEC